MIRFALGLLIVGVVCFGAPATRAEDAVSRGAYLVRIIGCGDCHTPGVFLGKPDGTKALAGSDVGFGSPERGIAWGPNLTPDPDTGLGKWTEAQIVTAIRMGVRPDGRQLAPSMPYNGFTALTDADAHAIAAYLKSLAPIRNKVPGPTPPGAKAPAPYMTVVMPQ